MGIFQLSVDCFQYSVVRGSDFATYFPESWETYFWVRISDVLLFQGL